MLTKLCALLDLHLRRVGGGAAFDSFMDDMMLSTGLTGMQASEKAVGAAWKAVVAVAAEACARWQR